MGEGNPNLGGGGSCCVRCLSDFGGLGPGRGINCLAIERQSVCVHCVECSLCLSVRASTTDGYVDRTRSRIVLTRVPMKLRKYIHTHTVVVDDVRENPVIFLGARRVSVVVSLFGSLALSHSPDRAETNATAI